MHSSDCRLVNYSRQKCRLAKQKRLSGSQCSSQSSLPTKRHATCNIICELKSAAVLIRIRQTDHVVVPFWGKKS